MRTGAVKLSTSPLEYIGGFNTYALQWLALSKGDWLRHNSRLAEITSCGHAQDISGLTDSEI
jgi:hypothetical protein